MPNTPVQALSKVFLTKDNTVHIDSKTVIIETAVIPKGIVFLLLGIYNSDCNIGINNRLDSGEKHAETDHRSRRYWKDRQDL